MVGKDVKAEARKKLALNMHQAIVIYTVEFTVFITLIALVVVSCVALGMINSIAAIVMTCYGSLLLIIAIFGSGMLNFAMTDFYLANYKCIQYNIRRLGETFAHSNITKVLLVNVKRMVIGFLLLLCFIAPGVIYLIRTSMANHLLIANPKMKPSSALSASNKVMSGKTGMYFSLCISLIGWYLLGVITLGLGFIFIRPYLCLVKTVFYKRNLQGDKNTYPAMQQAQFAAQNQMAMQQQQNAQAQQQAQGEVVPDMAPIDTLNDMDFSDMNAAMQDFGEQNGLDVVPEVPIMPPSAKPGKKNKGDDNVQETPVADIQIDEQGVQSRKIDGTGLVETERILSSQEISNSDLLQQQVLERMYSNAAHQQPSVNYFTGTSKSFEGFEDDFGVTPISADTDSGSGVEPLGTDEPIMSDSEFDEFLRNFDNEEPILPPEEPIAQPAGDVEPQILQPEEPLKAEQNANTEDSASEPQPTGAGGLNDAIERLRRSSGNAAAHAAPARQPINRQEVSDRAERLRKVREDRLKNKNPQE